MFENLGIALGAGVDEWHKQQEEQRKKELAEQQKAQFANAQEEFGWKRGEQTRRSKVEQAQDDAMQWAQRLQQGFSSGDTAQQQAAAEELSRYHSGSDLYGGSKSAIFRDNNGQLHAVVGGMDAGPPRSYSVTPQLFQEQLQQALMHRMAATSPEMMAKNLDYGLKSREVGAKEEANNVSRQHYRDYADNTRVQNANWYDIQQQNLALREKELAQQAAAQAGAAALGKMGTPMTMYDNDGNATMVIPTMTRNGFELVQATTPSGFRFTPKTSGERKPPETAMSKDAAKAITEMGARPAEVRGWLGGVSNQDAIDQWNRAYSYLNALANGVDPYAQSAASAPVLAPPAPTPTARPDLSRAAAPAQATNMSAGDTMFIPRGMRQPSR